MLNGKLELGKPNYNLLNIYLTKLQLTICFHFEPNVKIIHREKVNHFANYEWEKAELRNSVKVRKGLKIILNWSICSH